MADLTAANVTVVISKPTIQNGFRANLVTITFGDGALTYPTGGVPMPAFGVFGMVRNLLNIVFDDDAAQGVLNTYDAANNKIRIWFPTQQTGGAGNRAGVEYTGASTTVPATTLTGIAYGW